MKPKIHNVLCRALMPTIVTSLALTSFTASAAEIVKLQNNIALDAAGAWVGGVVPTAADVMLWDSTYGTPAAATTLSQLGASTTVAGLKVTNVGGTLNLGSTMVGFQNTSSGSTLTIGSLGIDLSNATQGLFMSSAIKLDADQTWNIKNANTATSPMGLNNNEDLGMIAQIANVPFNLNGKTLTFSGLGQSTISSGYLFSNGTINVNNNLLVIQGGTNRLTTVGADVSMSVSATNQLRLQSNSGAITSSAPTSVNGTLNLLNNNTANAVTLNGNLTLNHGCTLSIGHAQNGAVNITGSVATSGTIAMTVFGTNAITTSTATTVPLSANISGAITGSGNINLSNTSNAANGKANNIRLSGNNSGYTGTFTIGGSANRGVRLATANSGSSAATWAVNAGNVLEVDGVSVTLGTLNGAGTVTNSHVTSAATLQIGAGLFQGVIANGAAVTNLEKIGAGLLTLSGSNTFTGTTTVTQGILAMSSLATGVSNVTVADGAIFRVDPAVQDGQLSLGSVTLGSSTGSTLAVNNGNFSNPSLAPILTTNLVVNTPSTLEMLGANIGIGTFPVVNYTALSGSLGYSGLTLKLPPRVTGSMANNTGTNTIDVTITSIEGIRWKGAVDQNWDIDPSGAGAVGTANWETTSTLSSTRFLQGSAGTDAAMFDDLAAGSGAINVNLTTLHTPQSLVVNNATRDYTFAGSGSISGSTGLLKQGAATLTLANTTANAFVGGTIIEAGTLVLGDGLTNGAGQIAGSIAVDLGTSLVLNRPDDHSLTNTVTGTGLIRKNSANTLTLPAAFIYDGDVNLVAGNTIFSNGGELKGILSGDGDIVVAAGTVKFSGSSAFANTHTGDITLPGTSILRLEKDADTQAVGGNVYVTGTANGQLVAIGNNQFSSNTTLHFLGSAGDPMVGSTGAVTVKDVVVNTSNGTAGQLVMKASFAILGTATVNSGIFGAGSGTTATVNAINVTNAVGTIIRVAGNSAATTMNIGAGGITAVGGDLQVKFGVTDNDAIVNLGGNITTTGNFVISNGGYTGVNRNVINLTGTRTFTIGNETTTTCAADFADDATLTADLEDAFTGNLIKAGAGKLVLGPLCNVGHSGTTVVNEGTLIVNGTMPIQAPTLAAGTTLGGNGTITAATTIPTGATISPGDGTAATLNFVSDVTLAAGSTYAVDITSAVAVDKISAPAANLSAAGTIAVKLTGYAPVANDVFDIADATAITGTPTFDFSQAVLSAGLAWDTSGFATTGQIKVIVQGYAAFAEAITNPAHRAADFDADGDGVANVLEYVLEGSPTAHDVAILPDVSVSSTALVFTFSRSDNSENDTTQVVQFSTNLVDWTDVPITPTGTLPVGVTVDVVESGSAADTITVTIPKLTDAAKYARLKVTTP